MDSWKKGRKREYGRLARIWGIGGGEVWKIGFSTNEEVENGECRCIEDTEKQKWRVREDAWEGDKKIRKGSGRAEIRRFEGFRKSRNLG